MSVDLHAPHICSAVVLMFERGDPGRPIVAGVLRGSTVGWPLADSPAQVEVDADVQRMMISAHEQLVLRCGEASIALTKAVKVLVEGSYLPSRFERRDPHRGRLSPAGLEAILSASGRGARWS
jgi:hypothetical protein